MIRQLEDQMRSLSSRATREEIERIRILRDKVEDVRKGLYCRACLMRLTAWFPPSQA